MEEFSFPDEVPTAELMSEQEQYSLHLQALGFATKRHGGKMLQSYMTCPMRRILTIADIHLCLFAAMWAFHPCVSIWATTTMLLCVFTVPVGPLSFAAFLHRWVLDQIPMPSPTAESLRIGSPESASLIADYVMAPVVKAARTYVSRCEEERAEIERMIQAASDVELILVEAREREDKVRLLPM